MVNRHLSQDTLLAYLDGELGPEMSQEISGHLRACDRCAAALEEIRASARVLSIGLVGLDRSPPWEGMPERVRAALEERADRSRRAGGVPVGTVRRGQSYSPSRRTLAAAATLLLLLGGAAAAAIPGSPVRIWLERSVEAVSGLFAAPEEPEVVTEVIRDAPGVAVEPYDGRILVAITEAAPGVSVRVRVVDARLAAASAAGARFRTGRGRIEILAPEGELLVELPRTVREARIEVDGRPILEKRGPDLRLLTPAADTSGSEVRFELNASEP